LPGPAAVEVSAVSSDPANAYGAAHVITLPLPPGGAQHLSDFLRAAIAKDKTGTPIYIAMGIGWAVNSRRQAWNMA
jgi:hypothetical protein